MPRNSDPKIVTLYDSNFRDPVAALRAIADDIERGRYGDVSTVSVALLGDKLEIFSCGRQGEACDAALLFQAASLKFAAAVAFPDEDR